MKSKQEVKKQYTHEGEKAYNEILDEFGFREFQFSNILNGLVTYKNESLNLKIEVKIKSDMLVASDLLKRIVEKTDVRYITTIKKRGELI